MSNKKVVVASLGVALIAAAVGVVAWAIIMKKKKPTPTPTPTPTPAPKDCIDHLVGKKVFIQLSNGMFLSKDANFVDHKEAWERWGIEASNTVTGDIMIKNLQFNLYISAGPEGAVLVPQPNPNTWEAFTVECLDSTLMKIALKSYHGFYVGLSADGKTVEAKATAIGPNQTFTLIDAV
jgi:hypothetical protein